MENMSATFSGWESTWCRQRGWRISRRRTRDVCPDHSPPPSPWEEILTDDLPKLVMTNSSPSHGKSLNSMEVLINLMGKSSISMGHGFHGYVSHIQRVSLTYVAFPGTGQRSKKPPRVWGFLLERSLNPWPSALNARKRNNSQTIKPS